MQVSLITCTNNSEKTIKDCCLSIFSQTYKDIEHIVVDKNSQDRTVSIIKQYGRKDLKIYQQKGSGIYGALNEGMKIANGNIIGILHSDDELIDNQVIKEITEKFFEENLDVLFSNIYYTKKNDANKIVRKWFSNLPEGIQLNKDLNKKIKNGWMPPHTTLFIKKDLLREIGYYDESLKISSDYDFMIKLFRKDNLKIFFLNKVTVKMRFGGVSNKNIKNIFIKISEDLSIMKKYKFNVIKTILIKNLSKIKQFF
jgi:glycosyltransferase